MTKEEKLLYFVMETVSTLNYPNDLDDLKYTLDCNSELAIWGNDFKKKEEKQKKRDKVKVNRIAQAQEDVRNWANT